MTLFGILGFTTPWLLIGLIALPILWILLRAIPPAPVIERFPGVALLIGLDDTETETQRTPWWLLLLRALAVAALIIAFAGPVLDPKAIERSDRPLLVLMDGGWADAQDWPQRVERATAQIEDAARQGRDVALVSIADGGAVSFGPPKLALDALQSLQPRPWMPDYVMTLTDLDAFDTFWMTGGLIPPMAADLANDLLAKGDVTRFETGTAITALSPLDLSTGVISVTAQRQDNAPRTNVVEVLGTDPNGQTRRLQSRELVFGQGAPDATVSFDMPAELKARVSEIRIQGERHAGAVVLTDDRLKRREVALVSSRAGAQESLVLLSPLHYLRQALGPKTDLIEGTLGDMLAANPDTIILADVPDVPNPGAVLQWVNNGGVLVRFAGPRTAAAEFDRTEEDPLLPVRLRAGGRTLGGAMSWGDPKTLRAFEADTPFFGLTPPDEVTVSSQVLAEQGPDLAKSVVARLSDGTPLVTRALQGSGQIVFFHVTANADWSNLPLSGLFVSMLERLSAIGLSSEGRASDLTGTYWQLVETLDAFGVLRSTDESVMIDGTALSDAPVSADLLPGRYANAGQALAKNVVDADLDLTAVVWPADMRVETGETTAPRTFMAELLMAALILAALDIIATLALSGRLSPRVTTAVLAVLIAPVVSDPVYAQDDDALILQLTTEVVLGYVKTGDDRQDNLSQQGLAGLSRDLYQRTAIEPIAPHGVDLETDDISYLPFLYWPITRNQTAPSDAVATKVNRYLKTGGMILFDTRDGDLTGLGQSTKEGQILRDIAATLEIPPLAPVPEGHVLTRAFYLLQDFPGRHAGGRVWVEALPPADPMSGLPFASQNDGVTPVVIGGNDWAAAWAKDERGIPIVNMGFGVLAERQREIAQRFGVNLIMYVLTGNYKADQVHVPALLERLGQ